MVSVTGMGEFIPIFIFHYEKIFKLYIAFVKIMLNIFISAKEFMQSWGLC